MIKIIDLPSILLFMGFTLNQFEVWDDGDGPYIKEWLASTPEPTKKQIEAAYKKMTKSKHIGWGLLKLKLARAAALSNSDWTQLPDITLSNKAEWATWRQALRDVPKHFPLFEDAKQALKDLITNPPT